MLYAALSFVPTLVPAPQAPAWEYVSADSSGAASNAACGAPRMSADGRWVVFESLATDLGATDTNGTYDVYLRDRTLGTLERVSVSGAGVQGDGPSRSPSVSDDGRYVVFVSEATNLVTGDTNGRRDVFLRDRTLALTERVSVSTLGVQADFDAGPDVPEVSDDGRFVVFSTYATNLSALDGDLSTDVYRRDRSTLETELVSIDFAGTNNTTGSRPSLSGSGALVAFQSNGPVTVLSVGAWQQVYVRDMGSETSTLISMQHSAALEGSGNSEDPSLSSDGRWLAFHSDAADLDPIDTNPGRDVYLCDRTSGALEFVSFTEDDTVFDDFAYGAYNANVSDDGRFVVFETDASLVAGFTGGAAFLRDRTAGTTEMMEIPMAWLGRFDRAYSPSVSEDGSEILLGFTTVFIEGAGSPHQVLIRKRTAGHDGIFLTGFTAVGTGSSIRWDATHAPSSAACWLAYSFSDSGLSLFGHHFDLGPGAKILVPGVTTASGTFTTLVGPVPPAMAGVELFVELAAVKAGGWHDSNLLWLSIL